MEESIINKMLAYRSDESIQVFTSTSSVDLEELYQLAHLHLFFKRPSDFSLEKYIRILVSMPHVFIALKTKTVNIHDIIKTDKQVEEILLPLVKNKDRTPCIRVICKSSIEDMWEYYRIREGSQLWFEASNLIVSYVKGVYPQSGGVGYKDTKKIWLEYLSSSN